MLDKTRIPQHIAITMDGNAIDWATFLSQMQDAEVDMTIQYAANGMLSITATSTGSANTFVHDFAYNDAKSGNITVELGVEKAWLEILSVENISAGMTVSAAGWATLFTGDALNFSGIDGLTAYTATCNGTTVTLTEVNDVPANTGVVLKGTGTYSIPVIASSETAKGDLKGSTTEALVYDDGAAYDYYVLALNSNNEAQFSKLISGTVAAGKAYLQVDKGSNVRAMNVIFSGENTATGIATVDSENEFNGAMFNLAGQRVGKDYKGIVIRNGKKFLVK